MVKEMTRTGFEFDKLDYSHTGFSGGGMFNATGIMDIWAQNGRPMTHEGIVDLVYKLKFEPHIQRREQENETLREAKQVGLDAAKQVKLEQGMDAAYVWVFAERAMTGYMQENAPHELTQHEKADGLSYQNFRLERTLEDLQRKYTKDVDSLNAVVEDQRGRLENPYQTHTTEFAGVAGSAAVLTALLAYTIGKVKGRIGRNRHSSSS